jgi:hypothetical protein
VEGHDLDLGFVQGSSIPLGFRQQVPADISHGPRAIIVDANGKLLHRQGTSANEGDGLKDVQKVVAMLANPPKGQDATASRAFK